MNIVSIINLTVAAMVRTDPGVLLAVVLPVPHVVPVLLRRPEHRLTVPAVVHFLRSSDQLRGSDSGGLLLTVRFMNSVRLYTAPGPLLTFGAEE